MTSGLPPTVLAASETAIQIVALALFLAAASLTLFWARQMDVVMPMPGGWNMAMIWTPMDGQSQFWAMAMFSLMWLAMMIAMMLPSTWPTVLLYRRLVLARSEPQPHALLALNVGAYFSVWLAVGVAAYVVGSAIATEAMRSEAFSRLVPTAAGAALVVAGAYQLSPWKSACLRRCRDLIAWVSDYGVSGPRGALRVGLHHWFYCVACCSSLMLMQLMVGVMNLVAMVAITATIALEKLTVRGEIVARGVGIAMIVLGLGSMVRAALAF